MLAVVPHFPILPRPRPRLPDARILRGLQNPCGTHGQPTCSWNTGSMSLSLFSHPSSETPPVPGKSCEL